MLESAQGPKLFDTGSLLAGRYEVVSTIGTGGMGWVLHVLDRSLDRKSIALKVLYPHLVQDETTFARFRNEVVIARELNHPNIVRTYDIGQTESGFQFISMEFVHGNSLKELIYNGSQKGLPFQDAVRVLHEIAAGIAHAHSRGIVHRDLKPDNVLVSKLGEVKIADFGIARSLWQDHGLTKTGGAVGTPYYMAPEQLSGEQVDHRCDIYALGIIAYELVSGRRPFDDACFLNLAQMHLTKELPEIEGVPAWYQDLARACTAKDPAHRISSMAEIAELLREHTPTGQIKPLSRSAYHQSVAMVLSGLSWKRQREEGQSLAQFFKPWAILGTILALIGLGFIRTNTTIRAQTVWPLLAFEHAIGMELTPLKWILNVRLSSDEHTQLISVDRPEDLFDAIDSGVENEGDKFAIRLLMLAGMDPNTRNKNGDTALQYALARGQKKAVGELLRYGADPNLLGKDGQTGLFDVLTKNGPGVLVQLIKAGADVTVVDAAGNTLLHQAAARGQDELVRRLLDRGADPTVRNKRNETALFVMLKKPRWNADIAELLVRAGAPLDVTNIDGVALLDLVSPETREQLLRMRP